jgi:hypothetical protein
MFTTPVIPEVGSVIVETTQHRGFTPEELLPQAMDKIIYVGDNAHPIIRDQANVFKMHVGHIVLHYMHEAVRQDRATLAEKLRALGHPELVTLLEI